ncbi:M28 family peptidase [Patulibacter sp.]|uniref:M28 family peptidase n=1 Tax=Patulibacter sp. TaxID=1912859 RepID=UPI002720283F|nr:M28 family peptidase [Patulibacter sp.]MDO9410577.1 M28 family peptidase [Patulibacter sp.]
MSAAAGVDRAVLREVVETLAPLVRRAGSADEHRAADWIAERLTRAGAPAHVEDATFLDGYAPLIGGLAAIGAAAGVVGQTRAGRRLAMVAGALAAAAIVDDVSNGPRIARRAARRPTPTWNVVAEAGDRDAERTLVVMAHHDAAPSGAIFDQSLQRLAHEKLPGLFERADTAVPVWWPVVGGPVLAALGAGLRRRGLGLFGAAMSAGSVAAMADIARSPIVAGANDNLSAVAALVGLAERLRDAEDRGDGVGVRVLLVSCGAEEVIQGGIHSFAESWFPRLDRETTWFLNLDTIGSPELVSIEGEGPVVMEDYSWRSFRDLIERVAWRDGLPIRRGMRARSSTDAVVPSRAGYPTACLVSFDRAKAMPHYHLVTDVPENLDYDTIARAVALTEAVARELAGDAAQTGVTRRG